MREKKREHRKVETHRHRYNIYLDKATVDDLKKWAKERNLTRGELVSLMVAANPGFDDRAGRVFVKGSTICMNRESRTVEKVPPEAQSLGYGTRQGERVSGSGP